ncbi:unnamed protein product [Owenia fusiformis]|uniref:Uncharacterized protein n=1 Tax=Owenia fusiformis TaxID=6347 RepID=A0A8J1U9A1_OWEFU|nr:unnamed protein product [Owenia fusiformis]
MPHVNSSGGDDLASTDEVKVYKDEGEEEKRSSENLSEDKLGLVTETEEDKTSTIDQNYQKNGGQSQDGKSSEQMPPEQRFGPFNYLVPYPYHNLNGAAVSNSLGSKMPLLQPPGALGALMMYNNEHFTPPPAHMGIPPVHIDPKTGLPRHPMYPLPPPPGQFSHPYSPDSVQWNRPLYPITTSYPGPYPTSLVSSPTLSRFTSQGLLHHHPGLPPPGLAHHPLLQGHKDHHLPPHLQSDENQRHPGYHDGGEKNTDSDVEPPTKKKNHIKKPLNAFMLYMKEQRAQVIAECTLKESAAINQILGRKWHALDRSEQAKYYEMARKEKELHMQLYPGWSARDNYASHAKKKKRKRSSMEENKDCLNPKKCRARFGLDQQSQWCKPCRRKKKCIRFLGDDSDDEECDNVSNKDGTDVSDSSQPTSPADTIGSIPSQPDYPQSNIKREGNEPGSSGNTGHTTMAELKPLLANTIPPLGT